jgi:HPt (histidine-containing phosphotransfer) domain-containing protein
MDIHMPEMDGFQATRDIRKREGLQDLPIIAMTADAMEGGRERCLAAGMNDFLSKPFDPETLFNTLSQWIEAQQSGVTAPSNRPTENRVAAAEEQEFPTYLPGINLPEGLSMLGGDRAFYRRLLLEFRANYKECCGDLQSALDNSDRAEARRLVHNIKGISSNLGAMELYEASVDLDSAYAADNETDELIDAFRQTLTTVVDGLEKL